jgi:signal peptidase
MKNTTMNLKDIGLYVLYAVLGLLLVFIIMLSAFPDLTLNTIGVKAYVAKYDTMETTINPYDLVFINRVDPDELEVGDLITFYADIDYDGDADLVTYYVYSITTTNDISVFKVNAEGSSVPATPNLLEDDILGGYAFKLPLFGYVVEFISSGFGIAAILLNVGIITAIVILIKSNNKEEVKKEEPEKEEKPKG